MAPRVMLVTLVAGASAGYTCPGSGSFVHASMKVTSTASASCADVQEEITARASGSGGWTDPHNGGIYSVLNTDGGINTQRSTNPATSVGGQVYTDKQTFVLSDVDGGCKIESCSESQGTSVGDFSTNYCDQLNLFCGSADGCTPVKHDFTHTEDSHSGSIGAGHDSSVCIVKKAELEAVAADSYSCPGSGSLVHASMKVTATAAASCSDVQAEITARASGSGGWTDPHNGGIYSVLSTDGGINTQRTTNPATSVGGQVYTDKQIFVLSDADGGCQIKACSESQGTSVGDFSTNYCDIRNLFCGSADGCKPVQHDFTHKEDSHSGSIGAGHDAGNCIVTSSVAV